MDSIWKTLKKVLRISVIALIGVIIAGLEIKYPEFMGCKIFNSYSVTAVLYIIYDQIKHKWIAKLP